MNTFIFSGKDFDLKHTFDCGQCFRWNEENGCYKGVAGGYFARVSKEGDFVKVETDCPDESFWAEYFDIDRDYGEVKKAVSVNKLMEEAVSYGYGIRILKQDFFEALVSFIISQRSSIPKIKSSVRKLCENMGRKKVFEDEIYYTFPTPMDLKNATEEDFKKIGAGYRAKYLVKCVQMVLNDEISEEVLLKEKTPSAREMVMTISGVGDKVCDCVMLFSLKKYDLFPSDVWIKRVMCENFGSSEKTAKSDGEKLFGELSGFAQQYLFYYRRNMEKK